MLGLIMKSVPAMVAAGGVYSSFQESNPVLDFAKVALVNYEITTMARFIQYNAFGKGRIPTPKTFSNYLRDTMQSSRDPALDYWEQPYILEKQGKSFAIVSFGPDKKRNTEDDIRYEFNLTY